MVVSGVRDEDVAGPEPFGLPRTRSVVLPSIEPGFDRYIDALPAEVVGSIVGLLAFEKDGIATPFP